MTNPVNDAHRDWLESQAEDALLNPPPWVTLLRETITRRENPAVVTFSQYHYNSYIWPGIEPESTRCARGPHCLESRMITPDVGGPIGPILRSDPESGLDRWDWTDCWFYPSKPDLFFCESCIDDLEAEDPMEVIVTDGDVNGFDWTIWRTANGFGSSVMELTPPLAVKEVELPEASTLEEAWQIVHLQLSLELMKRARESLEWVLAEQEETLKRLGK